MLQQGRCLKILITSCRAQQLLLRRGMLSAGRGPCKHRSHHNDIVTRFHAEHLFFFLLFEKAQLAFWFKYKLLKNTLLFFHFKRASEWLFPGIWPCRHRSLVTTWWACCVSRGSRGIAATSHYLSFSEVFRSTVWDSHPCVSHTRTGVTLKLRCP